MLIERRRELQDDIHSRRRDGRTSSQDVRDDVEESDTRVEREIQFAVLELRTNTLNGIEQALVRLDAGEYGCCADCGGDIAERRLQVLPFSVRCQVCEGEREQVEGRARQIAQQRRSSSFLDVASS
jgi:DnaK suppressor protein